MTRWPFERVLWYTWRQSVNTDLGAGVRNVGGWAERGVVILKNCHHLVLKNPAAEVFIVRIEGNRNIKKGGL